MSSNVPTFVLDLEPSVQDEMCRLLDKDRAWEGLAQVVSQILKVKGINIDNLRMETSVSSPSRKILEIIVEERKGKGLSIKELYSIFSLLKFYEGMDCLEPYVPIGHMVKVEHSMKMQNANDTMYIYNLPPNVKTELCETLNADGSWLLLAARFQGLGITFFHSAICETEKSPADELFTLLAERNVNTSLLFLALTTLDCTRAMSLLERYVPKELIEETLSDRPGSSIINTEESWHEISHRELKEATNQWSDQNRLGSKSTGNFYWGNLGHPVPEKRAIKRLILKDKEQSIQVLKELRQLRSAGEHNNILKMLMFTEEGDDGNNLCLVYPFLEHQSLYDYLRKKEEPTKLPVKREAFIAYWQNKRKIALGVAEALLHLENCLKQAVIVKSSDILLNNLMEPLVVDVCFPSILERNYSKDVVLYLPQQEKTIDTSFCIGVILLELAMGRTADSFGKHPEEFIIPDPVEAIQMDKSLGRPSSETKQNWITMIRFCSTDKLSVLEICTGLRLKDSL